MSWNIHGGVGLDGQYDLGRIVDLARRNSPDIVALQEVGSRRADPGRSGAFALLSDALGNHATESRLITAPDGEYGHALFSRWPLEQIACHDISYRRREPRAAIEAVAHTPYGPLRIIAAHLGLSFRERRHQARLLAELACAGPDRMVLMGDLNDWFWRGSVQAALDQLFPGHTHARTFPSFRPVFALDRIYCRPTAMLRRSWIDSTARVASDHLPIIADLAIENTA